MNQEKLFVKFVIPCWGVESTIGKMLDSILSQTFQDFHIVCVEDCSPDKTLNVLEQYKAKFPNNITIIRNKTNLGAGQSRNIGVVDMEQSIPAEYLWIVDGDDYLADNNVLKDLHGFAVKNPNYDIINVGISYLGEYSVGKVGWPIASWGRIIRPAAYVSSPKTNIPYGNDVYSHFVMFDQVDDSRIGRFDRKCYVCPKMGRHHNGTEKTMNVMKVVGECLMKHEFHKKQVVDALMNGRSRVGDRLLKANPKFHPILKRKVSILMASFPYRKKWMLQCIDNLIGQCDNFYLWLNEYKTIPEELNKYDPKKLHITLAKIDMKENGRYTFLNLPEIQEDYCFVCDDDINWPKDYVRHSIECFRRNGDDIVMAYFINGGMNDKHDHDQVCTGYSNVGLVPHYRFGAGTCAFVPSLVKFKFTQDELLTHYDMELLFAQQCVNQGTKLYSPERQMNWISFIQDGKNQNEIERHALSRTNFHQRIRTTYYYMVKRGMVSGANKDEAKRLNRVRKFQQFMYG